MTQTSRTAATLDEYLDGIELAQEFREYVDGQVRTVPPTSLEHGLLVENLAWCLDPTARRSSCRVLQRGMLIRVMEGGNVFSPDAMVFCGTPRLERRGGTDFLLNPVLLAEVLSPGGGEYELGEKWRSYQGIPTLREYLLVYEEEPRVVRYSRSGADDWRRDETTGLESQIRLVSVDVTIRLSELYGVS